MTADPTAAVSATAEASTLSSAAAASSMSPPANQFELELEFVQSLASPAYLHYLATTGILYQRSFLDYLRYLRYWKRPKYAKYLSYPHCLHFLDLLVPPSSDDEEEDYTGDVSGSGGNADHGDNKEGGEQGDAGTTAENNGGKEKKTVVDSGEAFRREMAQVPFRNFVHEQQFYSWQFRSARLYGGGAEVAVEGEGTKEGEGS